MICGQNSGEHSKSSSAVVITMMIELTSLLALIVYVDAADSCNDLAFTFGDDQNAVPRSWTIKVRTYTQMHLLTLCTYLASRAFTRCRYLNTRATSITWPPTDAPNTSSDKLQTPSRRSTSRADIISPLKTNLFASGAIRINVQRRAERNALFHSKNVGEKVRSFSRTL